MHALVNMAITAASQRGHTTAGHLYTAELRTLCKASESFSNKNNRTKYCDKDLLQVSNTNDHN